MTHPFTTNMSIRPSAVARCRVANSVKGMRVRVPVHRHQQHPTRVPVQLVRPVQEVDAAHSGQVQVRGHQRHRRPGRASRSRAANPADADSADCTL